MRPMLATPGTHVPAGDDWVHEIKWDGIRILADSAGGVPRLWTRNENDATIAWPEVAVAPGRDLLVDGEIIALNARGRPDFRELAERMHLRDPRRAARHAERHPAAFLVFDLLRLDGRDVAGLPWQERRTLLGSLDLGAWQVPDVYDDGSMLHRLTREQELEGIVSKRRMSRYRPGERSKDWRKMAHRFRGSYVVGGWRPQVGTTDRLAAVLVGELTADGLAYRGRVGSGIGARESRLLRDLLVDAATSPFGDVPREDAAGTHWVEPLLVVDVETHGVGTGPDARARLRQPAFIGVRADLTPEELT